VSSIFRHGDRVIVNGRSEWPDPPGYPFANAEGTVVPWVEYAEVLQPFSEFIYVRIDKAESQAAPYVGGSYCFHSDNLIKIVPPSEAAL
jgi:hypothetical protein